MLFSNNKNHLAPVFLAAFLIAGITACVKQNFDEPPSQGEPSGLTANITIKDLKAKHVTVGGFDPITEDLLIGGVVVMDDRSGNYYKTLVIQDSTGGIEVTFNDGYLYNQFPVGRKIFIRCQDLLLTDYAGLTQLAGGVVFENGSPSGVGLTELQVRQKVVKDVTGVAPAPKSLDMNLLATGAADDYLSTLVVLEDVQFVQCDAGKTYADAVTKTDLNRIVEDCDGQEVILRSSGYAEFAAVRTPTGNGTLVGVLSKYNDDYQIFIRNLDDVAMDGNRCGSGGGPIAGTLTDISAIRALYTGSTTTIANSLKIKGVVISDRLNENLNGRNVFIQDATGGIVVRFTANHCFELGDELEIEVTAQELSEFHALRQVNNVPLEKVKLVNSGVPVTPRTATVAEINANFNAWESTLVRITGATVTGGATLSGNKTVSDGTGQIAMFTQSYAAFAGVPTPAGQVTITAIVSDYDGKQLSLRNAADIQQ